MRIHVVTVVDKQDGRRRVVGAFRDADLASEFSENLFTQDQKFVCFYSSIRVDVLMGGDGVWLPLTSKDEFKVG